jgi:hypothetical protein
LGDVQESVAKLSLPSYFYHTWSVFALSYCDRTSDLQHFSKPLVNTYEDILHVARQGLSGRYVIVGSPRLHKGSEAAIVNDLKGSVVLCDPTDKFGTGQDLVRNIWNDLRVKLTMPPSWCADDDYTPLFLSRSSEMQP